MVGKVITKRLLMTSVKELAVSYERLAHKVDTKINSLDGCEIEDILAAIELVQKEMVETGKLIDKVG